MPSAPNVPEEVRASISEFHKIMKSALLRCMRPTPATKLALVDYLLALAARFARQNDISREKFLEEAGGCWDDNARHLAEKQGPAN